MKANEKKETTTAERVEKQIKEKDLQAIIAKLQGTELETNIARKSVNGRRVNSIYLDSVYIDDNGQVIINKQEKQAIRRKIRKNLDKFISEYIRHKSDKKYLESLARDWVRSASKIYKNIFGEIYDGSDEETIRQTKEFVKSMQENLTA